MKVLQINAIYKTGSTGRTTLELHKYLVSKGIDSYVAYGIGERPSDKHLFRIENKIEYLLSNVLSRMFGDEGNHSYFATKRLIKWIKKIKPDVVHLRNLHEHYINLRLLLKYLAKHKEISVFISTHDFWFLTGHCPMLECEKWKSGCHDCPAKKHYPQSWFFDRSRKIFKLKSDLFLALPNFQVIGVSKFCESIVKQSYLKNACVTYIYNWINLDVFKPNVDSRFPFQKNKPIVLAVWANLNTSSDRFQDFLAISKKLSTVCDFVAVGSRKFNVSEYPSIHFVDKTDSTAQLAYYYSAADVFFDPSTIDTFGKVVAESLACGTPVVVYDNWALPELVGPNCGFVVPPHDIGAAVGAITKIISNGKGHFSKECRSFVETNFNYETNADRTLQIYKDSIKKDQA
jgi:putative colanic acid biosynthesis glycosyltransferase